MYKRQVISINPDKLINTRTTASVLFSPSTDEEVQIVGIVQIAIKYKSTSPSKANSSKRIIEEKWLERPILANSPIFKYMVTPVKKIPVVNTMPKYRVFRFSDKSEIMNSTPVINRHKLGPIT